MAKSIQLRFAVFLCWFFAAVATSMGVYASETIRVAKGLREIPYDDIYLVLLEMLFGGVLATLMKVTAKDSPKIANLTLEIARDSLGSFAAGSIGYLVMMWFDQEIIKVPVFFQPIIVFFCAYRGIKLILLIEPVANEVFSSILGMLREFTARFSGRKNTPPPPTDPAPEKETHVQTRE